MNNLSSYYGSSDARMRASEKDLSVQMDTMQIFVFWGVKCKA